MAIRKHIGTASLMKLRDHYSNLAKRTEGIKKKGAETVGHMVNAAEVSAGAFVFGTVQGRYGAVDILGVPVDLGTGVVLHLAGFMGLAGRSSEHLHAFGDGALASFFFTLGRGTGINWKQKALGTKVSGNGESLTEADLAALTEKKG